MHRNRGRFSRLGIWLPGVRRTTVYILLGGVWIAGIGCAVALLLTLSGAAEWIALGAAASYVFFAAVAMVAILRRLRRPAKQGHISGTEPGQRYAALFHKHPDAVYLLDRDGRFVEGNSRLGELLGRDAHQLIGQPFDPYVAEADRERVRAEFAASLRGDARHYELSAVRSDGAPLLMSITNVPFHCGGTITGVFGIGRDITERKRAQEALAASEQRYRALFEHSPDAVYLLDTEGRFVQGNASLESLLGVHLDHLVGASYDGYVLPADLERVRSEFRAAAAGEPRAYEADGMLPDGKRIRVHVTNIPMYREGRIAGVFGIAKDISAQSLALHALEASEARFRSIVTATDDAIIVVTEHGDILDANPAAERLFGCSTSALRGRNRAEFLDVDEPGVTHFYQRRDQAGSARGEVDIRRADGARIPVEITATLFEDEAGQRCAVVILRDISERKRAERRLAESEEQFRTVLDQTGHVVYQYDIDSKHGVWAGACDALFGYSAEALSAMTNEDRLGLVHPDDRERLAVSAEHLRFDGGPYRIEYRTVLADGQTRYLRERGLVSTSRNRIFAVIADIGAEAELNAELRASEERLREIAEHTGQVVTERDLSSGDVYFAGACEAIYGLSARELEALDEAGHHALIHPEDFPRWTEKVRPLRDVGGRVDIRFRILRPDGQVRRVRSRCVGLPQQRRTYAIIEDETREWELLDQLSASEERFRNIIRHTGQVVYEVDVAGDRATWGGACEQIMGLAAEQLNRLDFYGRTKFVHDEDREALRKGLRPGGEAGGGFNLRFRWIRPDDGRMRLLAARGVYLPDVSRVYGIIEDVTEQVRSEDRLRLVATAFERANEAILVCDRDFRIEDVNQAYVQTKGMSREEAVGRRPSFLELGEQGRSVRRALAGAGFFSGELLQRRANGEVFVSRASITAVTGREERVDHYVVNFSDISAERELARELDYLAWHDALTGLPNRAALEEWFQGLAQDNEGPEPVAIAFVDLDRFKIINESMGHAVGDELLKEVGRRLKRMSKPQDYLARPGGDEFLLALRGVDDVTRAERRLRRLLKSISAPFSHEGHSIYASASAGICIAPRDGQTLDVLLRKVEVALAGAKAGGRSGVRVYDSSMEATVEERGYIEHELRNALRRDELVLHFQPEVRLNDGRITGLEALVRWESPVLGLVPPAKFIPVAEETGLIVEIGAWVLREACRSLGSWRDAGFATGPVSVNLSAAQFLHADLIPLFRDTLGRFGIKPGELRVEVTESVAMLDPESSVEALDKLRALGVEIAVDDFGTGYSSLAYLRRFPVQYVKLDRTFVKGLPSDETNASIVASVIHLARDLGMSVIAEGIETATERDALRAAGCSEAQGFFFSPPLSRTELECLLRRGNSLPA